MDEITTLSKLGQKRSEKKTQLVRLGQREIETLGLSQGFWSDLYHRSMASLGRYSLAPLPRCL